jgi:hypothetical protein
MIELYWNYYVLFFVIMVYIKYSVQEPLYFLEAHLT